MFDRIKLGALLLVGIALPIMGCGSAEVDTLEVAPGTVTMVVGSSAQLTATGVYGHGTGPSTTQDLTNKVTWSSSSSGVASVSSSGEVMGVGAGTAVITATIKGFTGVLSASSAVTVTSTSTGTAGGDIASLTIIPGSQVVAGSGISATFLAVGTTASGATVNVNSQVVWSSSSAQIATIGASNGIAMSVGAGTATITAVYTNADETVATGTASITVTAGANSDFTALTILPASQSVSSGGTSNFIALATIGSTGITEDVTDSVTWSSSIPAVATVTATGVATGKSAGTATIEALLTNHDNSVVSGTSTVSVSAGTPPENILSLTIIPNSITVNNFYLTGQFLAIATYSTAPYVQDVTNSPSTTWISTEPELFPVDTNSGGGPGASAGLVTAYASGGAVIVAETTNTDMTIQTATATFNCPEVLPQAGVTNPSCYPNEPPAATLLATLTVYNEGLNTSDWLVTAPSATGTPDVIHCGPAWKPTSQQPGTGSVCTATYPMNITTPSGNPGIVLTATGGAFGGWSYNCIPSDAQGNYITGTNPYTAAGPNYCVLPFEGSYTYVNSANQTVTVTVDGLNQTVGAIFN
jgi:uncharacterized protein YjdB